MTASIGAVRVDRQTSPGEILRDADAAMYEAKRSGRNGWHVFDDATRSSVLRRLHLEQQLSRAIERNELDAHFQALVRCDDWSLEGIETLARWPWSGQPWVPPTEFVPVAEELGLIERLGSAMLDKAFTMLDAVTAAGFASCSISVNVSPLQLRSDALYDTLADASARGRRIEGLRLEMTEQHMVDECDHTVGALARLLDLGVGLAVDDFGTGHSSLGALHRSPVQALKLDRRLIEQVTVPHGRPVVAAVVGVAQAYGMSTVAEGVETVEQALWLRALGVDAAQGFLFAPPRPRGEILEMLARPWPWLVDRHELMSTRP